ncbi:hypothetical protein [Sphingomonas quercus]|uniref:Cell wall hydrolase n=1 Tax=Sphingomonas quercus TaxID=2842451 RepID=A0ABS6BM35_9SPHN|nr:hypothetical protein [Sphingomonas quercus]MBU3079393.1 hypothetical protein [Sphingomonas quercus]
MSSAKMMIGAVLAMLAAPLTAQAPAPMQEGDTPKQRAVNAVEAPVTQHLNQTVDAATAARDAQRADAANAAADLSAAQQEQYAADMSAYRSSVQAHRMELARDEVRYARQQRAYADAMAAWRLQAHDCQKGSKAACNAPPPDPAAFY